MKVSINGEKLFFHLRMWALPMLLAVVCLLQLRFPVIHRHCALWFDHSRCRQFFTCNFLSGGPVHLAVGVGGLAMVYSQFATQVRLPVFALAAGTLCAVRSRFADPRCGI